ncbi:BON domain-containing protein [Granulicella tundricola]|uniref:Transport-associated protein n=1 Tax=Granulicella tundricola (strain ATCC BAA-1859 / DSM 23138 / MP5ACTX9) TaxID=1198114 RepID=E8X4E2_GRATM|nr:BON domain-containing protein [Granulicella tundricola]ADW68269.1 transport-associated protein [Granulicella tundricola MP5ACTX9]
MSQGDTLSRSNISPARSSSRWTAELIRTTRNTALIAGMIASTGALLAQAPNVSDAQVESNVLKALAGAPELASEAITTRTVYGTVTLSGTVATEPLRKRAENLAANAPGVKKVVDQLTLGGASVSANQSAGPGPNMVLQSDGSYAPADSTQPDTAQNAPPPTSPNGQYQRNNPDADQALDQQAANQQPQQTPAQTNDPANRRPLSASNYPPSPQGGNYPPQAGQPYPQQQPQGYPPQYQQYPPVQPGYSAHGYAAPMDGGQVAGQPVTVPAGTLIRIRVNQTLSSQHSQPGSNFDGIIINDVVAGGLIAIPRGATVRGTVVDAKPSGALNGRGEMTLQLNQIILAGKTYPIVSDDWIHNGGDKTIESVNKTLGFGAVGALIGAVAGGGVGAAVGGGVGAAAGLGSSAASGRGQVFVPSEAVVTFHLAQPAPILTVSEQEMQRLAYGVAPGADPRYARRAYPRPYAPYPAPYPPPY